MPMRRLDKVDACNFAKFGPMLTGLGQVWQEMGQPGPTSKSWADVGPKVGQVGPRLASTGPSLAEVARSLSTFDQRGPEVAKCGSSLTQVRQIKSTSPGRRMQHHPRKHCSSNFAARDRWPARPRPLGLASVESVFALRRALPRSCFLVFEPLVSRKQSDNELCRPNPRRVLRKPWACLAVAFGLRVAIPAVGV